MVRLGTVSDLLLRIDRRSVGYVMDQSPSLDPRGISVWRNEQCYGMHQQSMATPPIGSDGQLGTVRDLLFEDVEDSLAGGRY